MWNIWKMAINSVQLTDRKINVNHNWNAKLGLGRRAFFMTLITVIFILSVPENHGKDLSSKLWG